MPRRRDARQRLGVIEGLARAVSHPLRRRILFALMSTREVSATVLQRQLGFTEEVRDLTYHLSVLALECDQLEVSRQRRVRGAVEVFYRLKGTEDRLAALCGPRGLIVAAAAAHDAGTIDLDGCRTVDSTLVSLDQQGMADMQTLLPMTTRQVAEQAETASRERVNQTGGELVRAFVSSTAFELLIPAWHERSEAA